MSTQPDIILNFADAIALGELLARSAHVGDADEAREALAAKLFDATIVEARAFPPDVVRLQSTVVYEELPAGVKRRVTLVEPDHADAATGRISILSPIARALLGRRTGNVVDVELPAGRQVTVRVLEAIAPAEVAPDPIAA